MRGMSYPTLRDKQPYQHDSTWMSSVDNSGVLEGRWPLNHQNARLFRASADIKDAEGHMLITAYPLERPDGQWAIMLINKDYNNAHPVSILFRDINTDRSFVGPVTSDHFRES
jgi:hypothetical protein